MNGAVELTPLMRQRRFLILMSLAVIGYYLLGVSVEGKGEIAGFVFSLEHHDRAVYGLWAIWVWASLRYGQRVYGNFPIIKSDLLNDITVEELRIIHGRALKIAEKELAKEQRVNGLTPRISSVAIYSVNATTTGPAHVSPPGGGRTYPNISVTLAWGEGVVDKSITLSMDINRCQLWWILTRAGLIAVFRLPAFFEHVGPLVIASGALLIGAWYTWPQIRF